MLVGIIEIILYFWNRFLKVEIFKRVGLLNIRIGLGEDILSLFFLDYF